MTEIFHFTQNIAVTYSTNFEISGSTNYIAQGEVARVHSKKHAKMLHTKSQERVKFGSVQGIYKGGSITVPLTSCLTGLESAV
jgi:hypothetical protein